MENLKGSDKRDVKEENSMQPTAGPRSEESLAELMLLSRVEYSMGTNIGTDTTFDEYQSEMDENLDDSESSLLNNLVWAATRRLAHQSSSCSSNSATSQILRSKDVKLRENILPTLSETLEENGGIEESEDQIETGQKTIFSDCSPVVETSFDVSTEFIAASNRCLESDHLVDVIDMNETAFDHMLCGLSSDLNKLALTVGEISSGKLQQIKSVLSELYHCKEQSEGNNGLFKMRLLQTSMALDTIDLMLRHFEEEDVLLAMTEAVRGVFDSYAHLGIGTLANCPSILTSKNIATVVIHARQILMNASVEEGNIRTQKNNVRRPGKKPEHKTNSRVKIDQETTSERSKRSILMSEGLHVLMLEKMSSLKYRPGSTPNTPFIVGKNNGQSLAVIAGRRKKAIEYGNGKAKLAAHVQRKPTNSIS